MRQYEIGRTSVILSTMTRCRHWGGGRRLRGADVSSRPAERHSTRSAHYYYITQHTYTYSIADRYNYYTDLGTCRRPAGSVKRFEYICIRYRLN